MVLYSRLFYLTFLYISLLQKLSSLFYFRKSKNEPRVFGFTHHSITSVDSEIRFASQNALTYQLRGRNNDAQKTAS